MDARTGDFKNSAAELSRSGASQTFKFERQDWALFRTAEGLSQKAGVPKHKLPRLVMKELADNGLDEGGQVRVGKLPDEAGYFVEDSGRGIDPARSPGCFAFRARWFLPSSCGSRPEAHSATVCAWWRVRCWRRPARYALSRATAASS
jgi:hypothetical protein